MRNIVSMDDKRKNITARKPTTSVGGLANGNRWLDTGLGKIPPQSVDLEEAVLGAVMLERDALTNVVDILKPESFYREAHQKIFSAVLTLFNNSEPVDLLTVTQRLRNDGTLEFSGGSAYLAELTSRISSAANVEAYARKIAENSIKRDLITSSNEVLKLAYEDTTDVFNLLDKAEQDLFRISESNIRKNFSDMNAVVKQALEELEAKKHLQDGLTGVASGFTALDRVTGGWQKSELIIIAARPAMGKTAFILSACRNAAVDWNQAVAIFSLEMSSVQLVNRLISAEAEIESEKIKKGSLANHEWAQLHARIGKLNSAPIFIDDTPALSILELRAKCRRLKQQHDIQLVVIDYLQLMQGDSSKGGGNREQEIASISRALKNLAKELNVPVIALSQLSRAVETRGGEKKPQLSDLRESGSIEQDADMVMFLYRPEYYGITQDENGQATTGVGEVIIGKNRSGSTETVQLRFINKFTKFADLGGGDFSMLEAPRFNTVETSDSIGSFESQAPAKTFGSKVNQQTQTPPPGEFGSFSTNMGDVPF